MVRTREFHAENVLAANRVNFRFSLLMDFNAIFTEKMHTTSLESKIKSRLTWEYIFIICWVLKLNISCSIGLKIQSTVHFIEWIQYLKVICFIVQTTIKRFNGEENYKYVYLFSISWNWIPAWSPLTPFSGKSDTVSKKL